MTTPPPHDATIDVPPPRVPLELAELHRALPVDARVRITLVDGEDSPGLPVHRWAAAQIDDVLVGAGFTDIDIQPGGNTTKRRSKHVAMASRGRTLADTVGAHMRLLVSGLNPSINAADAGVGFFKNGNRYWPAALAAGLVTRDRDPVHALTQHGIGMTDIAKRATARADELDPDEFRHGMERVERLITWLQPGAVCFVGLVGWRTAVDRKATAGVQPDLLGGRPVYVMPSTSGLNARTSLDDLTGHLGAAAALADTSN